MNRDKLMTESSFTNLSRDIGYVDLCFQGNRQVIATAVIHRLAGTVLVDPGPTTCLTTLRETLAHRGIGIRDLDAVLLTHIHLDHAGATGALVRENPGIKVYVHERGARHMVDPTRLLDSAKQVWGDDMDRLWGEVLPVPQANLRVLKGGERITFGERDLEVAYTPGHARHHVSYFDRASSIAFVGDVAGIRVGPTPYVFPPTPPPDIDIRAWKASAALVDSWHAETLFLTHFGPHNAPSVHLRLLIQHLDEMTEIARRVIQQNTSEEDYMASFVADMEKHLRQHLPAVDACRYLEAAPLDMCWLGLFRYWKKQSEAEN